MAWDDWRVACGGSEPERVYNGRDGYHWTYMYNRVTGDHAWYCHDQDLFSWTDPFNAEPNWRTSV